MANGNTKPGRRSIAPMQAPLLTAITHCAVALWAAALGVQPSFSAEVKRATINGAELSYVDEGTGEPIIFLHGVGIDLRIGRESRPS